MKCNIAYFSTLSNKLERLVSPLRFCLKSYLTGAKRHPESTAEWPGIVFKTSSLAIINQEWFSLLVTGVDTGLASKIQSSFTLVAHVSPKILNRKITLNLPKLWNSTHISTSYTASNKEFPSGTKWVLQTTNKVTTKTCTLFSVGNRRLLAKVCCPA